MSTLQHIDEYLYASGQKLTTADLHLLEKYDQRVAGLYCRPGCGDCLDSCPHGVPINDIQRYSMYAERYGRERDAMQKYARIDPSRRADHCIDCAAPCQSACDLHLPIREQLARADRLLRWG
jgi:predicted aldo/keto reductase-like oxidoreductase